MENAIYNSMHAANQLLEKQTLISNNLANISTMGFKEKFNYIINNKNDINEYYNLSPGTLIYTQRNLDLFIKNNGWFVVKDKNGKEAYTKNGHLKINEQGKLTVQNHELIGNNCDIQIPKNVNLEILSNGVINSINKNSTIKNKIGCLKLVYLPIKNILQKENGFFYLNKNSNTASHDNSIRVESGMLEESNVNPTKNMIDMISNVRQFEIAMKIISSCNQNSEYANQLLNINN